MSHRPVPTVPTRGQASAAPTVRGPSTETPTQRRSAGPGHGDRVLLAPPCADGAGRTGASPHRWLRRLERWLPCITRGRALALVTVSLAVLLGGALPVNADVTAASAPGGVPLAAQPPPPPVPTVAPGCPPGSPSPICSLPTVPPHPTPTGLPLPIPTSLPPCVTDSPIPQVGCVPAPTVPAPPPCTGEGCIPQPTSAPPPTNPGTNQPGQGGNGREECGITAIGGCITNAINDFFRGIVTSALNPLLDLLSRTLLTTPTPESMPRIGELWNNSWQILLASYAMLVLITGVLLMGYETLQTRHSVKEIAPRIVVGFLAGALSLWVASKAITIANAVSQAVMGGGVDADSASTAIKELVTGSITTGGVFIILIGIALAGMLVVLLITYIVRVAATIVLIAGAPIALMFHALPQTEGIAKWWWKAFGGCLAIQVCQSLTLITAMKVLLTPGGVNLFGPTTGGLVNLLVALALMYILFKIPFWILSSVRGGGGRSLLGRLVGAFVAYKTFGLLRGGGGGKSRPAGGKSGGGQPVDPYAKPQATAGGQYMLPLKGLKRGKPQPPAHVKHAPKRKQWSPPTPSTRGTQLALPLGDDWPENKPVLGRDGQYRLPLDIQRVTPTTPARPETGAPRARSRGGKQLEFPFDPYKGNRANRAGQYPLPLNVHRTPRPASPPPPPAPPTPRTRSTQMELPFDPYKGNRANRTGQYPLPLDGVRRTPPPTPPAAASPAPAARSTPRTGGQLRLPLDLPKPTRSTSPKPPKSGGTP
ncbi:Predicted membrane channel-forming protein YqfA, hemolysin III family [Actinokineospora alba]|uniref:Predicted membrane channel-forming protein YqfA, hemolysin III family n=1 Tax=Actinokineospora alba TaxID=504798 RepID=A0A1H0LFT3_9PSEU|nr:hypothetical protein [Actinokineospora alba]TDP67310.1 putative membrane channel-forming protein YqfA (hemolysin III family) [Actinokineospora alba]SDJ00899.1 Predicted membrane channel-forming protein YqfA, hemolysin III family [Actinokineospora alba]SDO66945.1 Predicted membrane channel-forming protein YqfA, hemolysin III family [Actinokineospora alba]